MDAGRAIEIGEPVALLSNTDSDFSKLVVLLLKCSNLVKLRLYLPLSALQVDQAGAQQRAKLYALALEHQQATTTDQACLAVCHIVRLRYLLYIQCATKSKFNMCFLA